MFACIGMTDKDLSWQQDYVMWPYGPCLRIFRKNATPTPAIWMNTTRDYAKEWPHHFDMYTTFIIISLIQSGLELHFLKYFIYFFRFLESSWEKVANDEMWEAK